MKRIVIFLICIVIMLSCFSGCIAWDPIIRYTGQSNDLMATAIHSIPGVESDIDDTLMVLEEDDYGRVMFAVCLTRTFLIRNSWDNCVAALVIMQKSNDNYVYFYPEMNYRLVHLDKYTELTEDVVKRLFPSDMISELKVTNCWNVPPTEEDVLMIEQPNSLEKSARISDAARGIIKQHIGSNLRCSFFREDGSGNQVYFVLHVAPSTYEWYLVAFNSDGKLCDLKDSILKINHTFPGNLPSVVQDYFSAIQQQLMGEPILSNWILRCLGS